MEKLRQSSGTYYLAGNLVKYILKVRLYVIYLQKLYNTQ